MLVLCHIHYMLKMTAVQTPESIAVVACAPDFEAAKEVILVFENVQVRLSTIGDCGGVMSLAFLPFVLSCLASYLMIQSAPLLSTTCLRVCPWHAFLLAQV